MYGYDDDVRGLEQAIKDGVCRVYTRVGEEMEFLDPDVGLKYWLEHDYKVDISFPVNSPVATLNCAIGKLGSQFIVDAISTDGGSIPRNVIVANGIKLVKYGALTHREFVQETSYNPARMFGLVNKGHFSEGSDADITIIDTVTDKAAVTVVGGNVAMINDYLIKRPGNLLITEQGIDRVSRVTKDYDVVDLERGTFFTRKNYK